MKINAITVKRFHQEHGAALQLELLAGKDGLDRIIGEATVNRPGLALAGFTRYFALQRIQVIGAAESAYLKSLPEYERARRYRKLFSYRIPCLVLTRSINPDRELLRAANQSGVPVFKCPLVTKKLINQATLALEMMFAPRGTEIGSMVDILGIGVIIRGESGIGKSECVLELIERGYSLVSDDITRVELIDGKDVVGRSDEMTRNLMEVRGIGIINVAAMFGVKAVRTNKRVDLVVTLKAWAEVKDIDRLGLESQYEKVLGIDVPHITLPVRPGRNLARLVEVAAYHTKMKLAGINPARELNERLIARMNRQPEL
jgi:HPr kinase/phosphorylase